MGFSLLVVVVLSGYGNSHAELELILVGFTEAEVDVWVHHSSKDGKTTDEDDEVVGLGLLEELSDVAGM